MPNLYTHFLFGQELIEHLPDSCRGIVRDNRMLFNLGLQGPDIFFYGSIFKKNNISQFGSNLHILFASDILSAMVKHMEYKEGEEWGGLPKDIVAYLLGFIGHFTLDTIAHPYIFSIQETERNHLALETDFDQHLLRLGFKVPWRENLAYTVKSDRKTRKAIEACYGVYQDQITKEDVSYACKSIYRIRKLMTLKTNRRAKVFISLMQKLSIPDKFQAMFIYPPSKNKESVQNWPDKPGNSISILEEKYKEAKAAYLVAIQEFQAVLEDSKDWPAFFKRDFGEHSA